MSKNQHVVPRGPNWAVVGEGNSRAPVVPPPQREALDRAREISRNQHGEVFIHNRRGQIRERDSHGRDPRRSRG